MISCDEIECEINGSNRLHNRLQVEIEFVHKFKFIILIFKNYFNTLNIFLTKK